MRFLVALDGSDKAPAAFAAAGRLARAADAELLLVNVFSPWVDMGHAQAPTMEQREAQVTAERQAYLTAQARAAEDLPVRTLVEKQRRGEEVDECIARVAREQQADLVVVASKRAAGFKGALLGSTAQALLRSSPCPVLIARPD